MGKRRKGRETALQILYKMDLDLGLKSMERNQFLVMAKEQLDYFSINGFESDLALTLANGVFEHLSTIDRTIENAAENWTVDRLAVIDRNILRLAVYELKYLEDIPYKATINEAIEIGKRFGSEHTAKFVNGVLDRVYRLLQVSRKPTEPEQEGSFIS